MDSSFIEAHVEVKTGTSKIVYGLAVAGGVVIAYYGYRGIRSFVKEYKERARREENHDTNAE